MIPDLFAIMTNPKLVQIEDSYSLLFDNFSSCESIFIEEGHEGSGYDWESVVAFVVQKDHPALHDKISYHSESSMFVAYGYNKEALTEAGRIIDDLIENKDKLRKIIREIPESNWD